MLFKDGYFVLPLLKDKRTFSVLQGAIHHASAQICLDDVLVSAINSGDTKILTILSQVLEIGCTPTDLRDLIEVYHPASTSPHDFDGRLENFSSPLLESLYLFDKILSNRHEKPPEITLELLLLCVFEHFDEQDREHLTIFNVDQCIVLLNSVVNTQSEPAAQLFDTVTGELCKSDFSELGWITMEKAAAYATSLGNSTILPAHCFLALVSGKDEVTEYILRLQLKPRMSIDNILNMLEKALRITRQHTRPVRLMYSDMDETLIHLLQAAQRNSQIQDRSAIENVDILSVMLENFPAPLATVLQKHPLYINNEKMRSHLIAYTQRKQLQIKYDGPFRLPAALLPCDDLSYLAITHGIPEAIPINIYKQGKKIYDPYDEICRALHRREKNHVLVTGSRGVGKATLVREIARRASTGEIPFLQQKRFLLLDARDVPPHESREIFGKLFSFVEEQSNIILCINGVGQLLRAESGRNNNLLLRKVLKEGQIQLIGIASQRDYQEFFSSDYELLEFFTRVTIEEPEEDTALAIIKAACNALEQDFQIKFEERAIERTLQLSSNYILNECLPAKAIKILRRACENLDYERMQNPEKGKTVTAADIITIVAHITDIPAETLTGMVKKADYETDIATFVVGQDAAIKTVASELRRIKAGWTDSDKPASVMLFAGLTGVGKTELAKVVAQLYSASKHLQTYTMGNFTEPHSVSGIIGSPPGYIGYTQGGRLIQDLNADPYCVFLLDEAEKAHPEVWKPFLNLFDEAWITDTQGTKAYADKAIFILTSNAGSEIISQMWQTGERNMDKISARVKDALLRTSHERSDQPVFTPEFLARIRHIVIFKPLDLHAMEGICRKHLLKIQRDWLEKREKKLIVPDALIQYIAERSFQENQRSSNKEGGRIVEKVLSNYINGNILQEQLHHEQAYKDADVIELLFEYPENVLFFQQNASISIKVEFRQQAMNRHTERTYVE